ncbi:hypothetical protein [Nonomuraea wenchangensis]|uniref:hypothetical protein n=1 Tax=Nonomuraea wenchangensis TaxID=568860 RepID=UPI0033D88208
MVRKLGVALVALTLAGCAASRPAASPAPSAAGPSSPVVMVTPAASPYPRPEPRCGGDGVPGDLDGDGCADVVISVAALSIFWGGLGPATVLAHDGGSGVADLDGDDAIDLMAVDKGEGADGSRLVLLHGPFTRSGRPARETSRPLPEGEWPGRLVTDPHGPGAVLYGPDDGEQARAWLLAGGGFREVATGSSAVFGDFDGDGRRDVAIGDSGARNDEPGSETEAPSVDGVTASSTAGAANHRSSPACAAASPPET